MPDQTRTRLGRAPWLIAAALVVVLAALAGRYGYHRDELYFIAAGHRPQWGYPDQPWLVPLAAAGWDRLTSGSLTAFRVLPALLAGLTVIVAAATARELGGSRRDATATAAVTASAGLVLAVGHLFSTTTFELLLTSAAIWLTLRAVNRAGLADWLLAGAAAGAAMHAKLLPGLVLSCAALALLALGPRPDLRRLGPWAGAALAAALAVPPLAWQAAHGWPQLELGRAIAAGSSASSVDRWLVVPFQLVQPGPLAGAALLIGLVRLLRAPGLRRYRWLAAAYLLLLAAVVATGGKPYYTAGLMPALFAAGSPALLRWAARGRLRLALAGALAAVHLAGTAIITLPVLPVTALHATPVPDLNPDAAETVGWPALVRSVTAAAEQLPDGERARSVVLAANYGQAGALEQAARDGAPLPPVYSGHNGYADWGPPPAAADVVILVGRHRRPGAWFADCRLAGRVDNGVQLENEEQGTPIQICREPTAPWQRLWPQIRRLS